MKDIILSELIVERLTLYHRCVKHLRNDKEKKYTDSSELSGLLNIDSSLIRRDLSLIGKFGKRGMGYSLEDIYLKLDEFLCKNKKWNLALIGIGNLGNAILRYIHYSNTNYKIKNIYDKDPLLINTKIEGYQIRDINTLSKEDKNDFAILTVPDTEAQKVADSLIKNGCTSILNFAPITLTLPDDIYYREIDLIRELDIAAGMLSLNK